VNRIYRIPVEYINFDKKNVLAVRVYDSQGAGGIKRERIGIYIRPEELEPEIALEGLWQFKLGDNLEWKEFAFNDTNWKYILVPAYWETQGIMDYDGFAWYRNRVIIPEKLRGQNLILFLGKIDNVDEVYLNGFLVGQTGSILEAQYRTKSSGNYRKWRAYPLNSSNIYYNAENVIAVRMYDIRSSGGIYQGPICVLSQKKYEQWRSIIYDEDDDDDDD
jgi:sialate O-acetylesterase